MYNISIIITAATILLIISATFGSETPAMEEESADTLYDIYKGRLIKWKNDDESIEKDFLNKGDDKRSPTKKLNIQIGNLYDEFKRRLDRFNDAINVDIVIENNGGKRSPIIEDIPPIQILPDNIYNSYNTPLDTSGNSINRENRNFLDYFKKKTPNVTDAKTLKSSNSSLNKRLDEWTGGVVSNKMPKRDSKFPYFIWQKVDKKSNDLDDYEIGNFINKIKTDDLKEQGIKIRKREADPFPYKRETFINNLMEDNLKYGLIPWVFSREAKLFNLRTNGNMLLNKYAKALNISVIELAKQLATIDPIVFEEKLQDVQTKTAKYETDTTHLDAAILYVLQDLSKKNNTESTFPEKYANNSSLNKNHTTVSIDEALKQTEFLKTVEHTKPLNAFKKSRKSV